MRLIIFSIVLIFCAYAELPDLGSEDISPLTNSKRRELANEIMSELYAGRLISEDPHLTYLVQGIAERLVKPLGMHAQFHVANIRQPNAFALPDGQIVIHTGLISLAQNEDELAAVLAHELSHVLKHHVDQMVDLSQKLLWQQLAGMALGIAVGMREPELGTSVLLASNALSHQSFLSFSREREFEADETAHAIILAAGYNPHGMAQMFTRFEEMRKFHGSMPAYLLTHPQDAKRIESAKNWAKAYPDIPTPDPLYQFQRARIIGLDPKLVLGNTKAQKPRYDWEFYGLAITAMRTAQWEKALKILEKHPSTNYLYHLAYAECLEHLKGIKIASEYLWAHWQTYRHIGPYALITGEVLFHAQRYEQAILSLDISPASAKRAALMQKTYTKLHKPLQALLAEADYWYYNGKIDKGIKILRDALQKSPSKEWNDRLLAKIEDFEARKKG